MSDNLDPNEIRNTNEAITNLGDAATDAARSLGKLSDSEATATKKATDSVDKLAKEFNELTKLPNLNYNLIYNFDFDFSKSALTVFMKNIPKDFNVYASYEYRKNKYFDFKIYDLNEEINHSKNGF